MDIAVDDIILDSKTASTLGIILNELITNSMKYAFKKVARGIIGLKVFREASAVVLEYRDNGPGIPGTVDGEHSTGFGMHLIYMLVQQLGGSLKIDRGERFSFIIQFIPKESNP
jgi:two-component sensor histidine kinase